MHITVSLLTKCFKNFLSFFGKGNTTINGFAPAVREFTKIMTAPFKHLRASGKPSVKYLDDSLLIGKTNEFCVSNIADTLTLTELGFTIHPKKSVLVPTQEITFLGFVINSVIMKITLTMERKLAIINLCSKLPNIKNVTIREFVTIVSSMRAVPLGRLHYRELEFCKISRMR